MEQLKALVRNVAAYATRPAMLVLLMFTVGFILARVLPPFILDDPFWRAFWSGPPAAGIFAVIAASLAYAAAIHSATVARTNAEADAFWKQAEWSLNLALSDASTERAIGLASILP
ncbi:hypothetical protein OK351_13600 [Glutamicibacter sp. MNS18]|uniref:hypothetical protein n=1 Tax=Glutamicibacter sp. MNS18 TaxID=2989817 RepID=UPI00223690F8|nr:hypothetical protein [Glutamicibacter sp. MNS18]MCW4466528.1 hypothetical protein [Glutamicibacter sp. MNS18]